MGSGWATAGLVPFRDIHSCREWRGTRSAAGSEFFEGVGMPPPTFQGWSSVSRSVRRRVSAVVVLSAAACCAGAVAFVAFGVVGRSGSLGDGSAPAASVNRVSPVDPGRSPAPTIVLARPGAAESIKLAVSGEPSDVGGG
jgi:hypothetical protein